MLLETNYAQNYDGIISLGLFQMQSDSTYFRNFPGGYAPSPLEIAFYAC